MLVRPMLLHRMALVSVRLFCKNLGNLQEFFGQMVYRPPWQKIARTPMTPRRAFCILVKDIYMGTRSGKRQSHYQLRNRE